MSTSQKAPRRHDCVFCTFAQNHFATRLFTIKMLTGWMSLKKYNLNEIENSVIVFFLLY
jgi:hypothetical protein